MADVNDKFKVTIQLCIEKQLPDGSYRAFSTTTQEYEHMPYEYMQQVQALGVNAVVQTLLPLGNAEAERIAAERLAS